MAALSMGAFGAYKQAYRKYLEEKDRHEQELACDEETEPEPQTVWVTKRYIPTDLRATAPVPRYKLLAPMKLPPVERQWVPSKDPPLRSFNRAESDVIFVSHPASRCEEYSTLRQMIPSRGNSWKSSPANWGTSYGHPPSLIERPPRRFPIINSPMTRYVDDMHLTNRLFKLH